MLSKTDTKLFKEQTDRTVKCKCGHSIFFKKSTEKLICHHCGHWVYRTKEIEKKYRLNKLKEYLKKELVYDS